MVWYYFSPVSHVRIVNREFVYFEPGLTTGRTELMLRERQSDKRSSYNT